MLQCSTQIRPCDLPSFPRYCPTLSNSATATARANLCERYVCVPGVPSLGLKNWCRERGCTGVPHGVRPHAMLHWRALVRGVRRVQLGRPVPSWHWLQRQRHCISDFLRRSYFNLCCKGAQWMSLSVHLSVLSACRSSLPRISSSHLQKVGLRHTCGRTHDPNKTHIRPNGRMHDPDMGWQLQGKRVVHSVMRSARRLQRSPP